MQLPGSDKRDSHGRFNHVGPQAGKSGVNYWRRNLFFRAELACLFFGALWPFICGFGAVSGRPGRLRQILGRIRYQFDVDCFAAVRFDTISTLF